MLFERENNAISALSLSALILLIINPHTLLDIGFQLSFAATWSLLYVSPIMDEIISGISFRGLILSKAISKMLSISLSPMLATMPIIAYHFNQVIVGGILANIIVLPLVEFIVVLGVIVVSIGFVFAPLAIVLGKTESLMLSFVNLVSRTVGSIPGACFSIGPVPIIAVIIYYFVLIYYLEKAKEHKRPSFMPLLAFAFLFTAYLWCGILSPVRLEVDFIDVGQGDSILVRTPENKTILIDGGGKGKKQGERDKIGTRLLLPYLRRKGINHLDLAVITHRHADHMNGLLEAVKEIQTDKILGREIVCSVLAKNRQTILLDNGITAKIMLADMEDDNNSVVIRLSYKKVSFLFTGDLGKEGEQEISREEGDALNSTVLKVGHHGSTTSSSPGFLDNVSPKIAVISVGRRNVYHLPNIGVLGSFAERGIKVLRTDELGTISMQTDGEKLNISTEN